MKPINSPIYYSYVGLPELSAQALGSPSAVDVTCAALTAGSILDGALEAAVGLATMEHIASLEWLVEIDNSLLLSLVALALTRKRPAQDCTQAEIDVLLAKCEELRVQDPELIDKIIGLLDTMQKNLQLLQQHDEVSTALEVRAANTPDIPGEVLDARDMLKSLSHSSGAQECMDLLQGYWVNPFVADQDMLALLHFCRSCELFAPKGYASILINYGKNSALLFIAHIFCTILGALGLMRSENRLYCDANKLLCVAENCDNSGREQSIAFLRGVVAECGRDAGQDAAEDVEEPSERLPEYKANIEMKVDSVERLEYEYHKR
jgi:hypothetical protein